MNTKEYKSSEIQSLKKLLAGQTLLDGVAKMEAILQMVTYSGTGWFRYKQRV